MFIIHVESVDGWWIRGVFSQPDSFEEYLALFPDDEYWKQYVVKMEKRSYLFYICEDQDGCRFLWENGIIDELERYAHELRREDERWCYTNLHRIDRNWRPKHPGDDCMGLLPHHHVANSVLDWIERPRFQALWD